MPVEIRQLGPQDWRLWRELRLEALADTPMGFMERHADAVRKPESDWRARLERDGLYLVAYDGQQPVAMSLGYLDGGRPMLGAVFVRPEARGRGVLDALVDRVQRWALEDHGSRQLHLLVHEDNGRARRAYERLGFVATGRTAPYELVEGELEQEMVRAPGGGAA